MEYTLNDFLNADINIKKVSFTQHFEHPGWSRMPAFPRIENGLNFLISGAIEYNYGGEVFRGMPGQVIKLPAGVPHSGIRLDATTVKYVRIDFVSDPAEYAGLPLPYAFTPSDPKGILKEFLKIDTLFHSQELGKNLACKNALYALLLHLLQDVASHQYHYNEKSDVLKICQYIQQHYQESSLRVEDIAASLHMSGTHLRRIFEEDMGMTPMEYIVRMRMEHADEMLRYPQAVRISAIADACGYSSVYYFSAAFRRYAGCSPSEYRRRVMSDSEKSV